MGEEIKIEAVLGKYKGKQYLFVRCPECRKAFGISLDSIQKLVNGTKSENPFVYQTVEGMKKWMYS